MKDKINQTDVYLLLASSCNPDCQQHIYSAPDQWQTLEMIVAHTALLFPNFLPSFNKRCLSLLLPFSAIYETYCERVLHHHLTKYMGFNIITLFPVWQDFPFLYRNYCLSIVIILIGHDINTLIHNSYDFVYCYEAMWAGTALTISGTTERFY